MKKAEKSSDGMLIMFNCILCSFCDKLFDSGTSKGQVVRFWNVLALFLLFLMDITAMETSES